MEISEQPAQVSNIDKKTFIPVEKIRTLPELKVIDKNTPTEATNQEYKFLGPDIGGSAYVSSEYPENKTGKRLIVLGDDERTTIESVNKIISNISGEEKGFPTLVSEKIKKFYKMSAMKGAIG